MKILTGTILALFIVGCVAPPVDERKKKHDKENEETNEIDSQVFDVEYKRYLQEVVNVLEGDEEFRNRLMKADPDDIKSGKISKELEFVNHNVRSKLDELKRQELERLRHAAVQEYELSNGIDRKHMKIPGHVDPKNPHTFESEDLRKLIVHTAKELEEADRQRKEEFKEYEMQKELSYQEQLKHLDESHRKEAEAKHEQQLKKHKEHQPLHHPGSKQQLEEVWEQQDHLSPEDFNPKTFFHLHDLDGNGVWDANEVKALFKKELDKMYDPNMPEDDIRERAEEMERMREHVFNESDTNKDMLISYEEFVEQTKKQEFERDEGWKGLDDPEKPIYTDEEYKKYAQEHEAEIRRMMDQGLIPQAPPGFVPMVIPPGHHYDPSQVHHAQPIYHDPNGAHPNSIPNHPGQPQHYQQQQQQYHPAAPHPNQIPQQQFHPGQQHPNQVPQQFHQGQPIPPNSQQHPIPQQQQPNPVPQQQYAIPQQHQQNVPVQQQQYAIPQQHQQNAPVQQQQYAIPQQHQQNVPVQQNHEPAHGNQNDQQTGQHINSGNTGQQQHASDSHHQNQQQPSGAQQSHH